ncbi:hypothetical protein B4110_2439 [Parageobacillus toebii]|uniref:Uncharacterized protein n=1 Tax=Parageobacillus toebii TaxID=153151 RepID=A0A150N4S6_9BACL|nr:hypothetical protein B4110_2439 [Parageobacillus toebii]
MDIIFSFIRSKFCMGDYLLAVYREIIKTSFKPSVFVSQS